MEAQGIQTQKPRWNDFGQSTLIAFPCYVFVVNTWYESSACCRHWTRTPWWSKFARFRWLFIGSDIVSSLVFGDILIYGYHLTSAKQPANGPKHFFLTVLDRPDFQFDEIIMQDGLEVGIYIWLSETASTQLNLLDRCKSRPLRCLPKVRNFVPSYRESVVHRPVIFILPNLRDKNRFHLHKFWISEYSCLCIDSEWLVTEIHLSVVTWIEQSILSRAIQVRWRRKFLCNPSMRFLTCHRLSMFWKPTRKTSRILFT